MGHEVLAVIEASPLRRWLGVGMLMTLGILMIYVALATPPAPVWRVILLVLGAGAVWVAEKMRRATAGRLELSADGLRDGRGDLVAAIEDIVGVDRGFFAFKPSNGFLIRTRQATGPRVWHPGLWWRAGRRIGIGGVTPGQQTRMAADVLAAMLIERERGERL